MSANRKENAVFFRGTDLSKTYSTLARRQGETQALSQVGEIFSDATREQAIGSFAQTTPNDISQWVRDQVVIHQQALRHMYHEEIVQGGFTPANKAMVVMDAVVSGVYVGFLEACEALGLHVERIGLSWGDENVVHAQMRIKTLNQFGEHLPEDKEEWAQWWAGYLMDVDVRIMGPYLSASERERVTTLTARALNDAFAELGVDFRV